MSVAQEARESHEVKRGPGDDPLFRGTVLAAGVKPTVVLDREGAGGNAFAVLGACQRAWQEAHRELGVPKDVWSPAWTVISAEMIAQDYAHLIATAQRYFLVAGLVAVFEG